MGKPPNDGEQRERQEVEDREAILRRRARFVAAAIAGLATLPQCDSEPQACLSPPGPGATVGAGGEGGAPQPCLDVAPGGRGGMGGAGGAGGRGGAGGQGGTGGGQGGAGGG